METLLDKKLISTRDASKISGYSSDYLARLARAGKIRGAQIGRTWVVDRKSLQQFIAQQEKHKENLARALARTRADEYQVKSQTYATPHVTIIRNSLGKLAEGEEIVSPWYSVLPQFKFSFDSVPVVFVHRAVAVFAAVIVVAGSAFAAESPIAATFGNTMVSLVEHSADAIARAERAHLEGRATIAMQSARGTDVADAYTYSVPSSFEFSIVVPVYEISDSSNVAVAENENAQKHNSRTRITIPMAGEFALSIGTALRDADIAFARSLVNSSREVIALYVHGVRSWSLTAPEIPHMAMAALYSTGDAAITFAASAPHQMARGYESAILAFNTSALNVARGLVENEIALGAGLTKVSNESAQAALAPVQGAGTLAYHATEAVSQTALALTDAGRSMRGIAAALRGELELSSPTVKVAVQTNGPFEKAAVTTYEFVNRLFSSGSRSLAFLFGYSDEELAIVPNATTLPFGTTTPAFAPVVAIHSQPAHPSEHVDAATSTSKTNVAYYVTKGADKAYVDASIGSLRTLMYDVVSRSIDGITGTNHSSGGSNGGAGAVTSYALDSVDWGQVKGTLADQHDLHDALAEKFSLKDWFATTTAPQLTTLALTNLTLSNITGTAQCLHADASGVVSGTGSDCGSGTGGMTSVTSAYPFTGLGTSISPLALAFGTSTNNTWGGTQTFTGSTQMTSLTVNNPIAGNINGNAGTVTNGVYTNTFGGLFDTNLMATSSVANISALPNLGTTGTITSGVWHGTAIADSYISSAATWNAKQNASTNLTTIGALANATGWLKNNGSGTFSYATPTATDVGLGSVTNDAQTKASIVPNTLPTAGQMLVGNAGGTAYAPVALSGDATLASTGALTLKNVGSTGTYGSASQVPVFTTDAQGRVTGVTNTAIAINGSAVSGNIAGNAANVTGTVAVANGGTGAATFTAGSVLVGNGTSAVTATTTANLKATLALNNVENTALSTWAGSANLTTLGTIVSGIWHGSAIEDAYIASASRWDAKQNAITGTTGQIPYFSADNTLTATSTIFVATNGNVGIGTTNPTKSLSFSGNAAQTIGMERNTNAAANGLGLTMQAGGATVGATDKTGGTLYLNSGISTGAGAGGSIYFQTADASGTSGASDNSLSTKMTLSGKGNLGVGSVSSSAKLYVYNAETNPANTYGILNEYRPTFSADPGSGSYYSFNTYARPIVNAGVGATTANVTANYSMNLRNYNGASADDSGTLGSLSGIKIGYGHYGTNAAATPQTTNAYGLYLSPYAQTGTITSLYDIYLASLSSGGTVTNRWALYQQDVNARNYFAGNVGVGTTSPTYRLSVEGTSSLGNQAIAGYFTATTTATSTFSGPLSVLNLALTNIASGNLLKTGTNGYVVPASAGTDYVANTSGNWTGTWQNHNASYFMDAATTSVPSITTLAGLTNVSTSLTGVVKAVAGALTAGAVDLATEVSGTLTATKGGTGIATYTTGDILFADSTDHLTTLHAGGNGSVLKIQAGIPAWGLDLTTGSSGGSDGIWATSTDIIYPIDGSQVVIGGISTSTLTSIFEVHGSQYISGGLTLGALTGPLAANNGTVYQSATTTAGTGLTYTAGVNTFSIATGAISDAMLASTFLKSIGSGSAGTLAYWTGSNTLAGAATSTLNATAPLSGSFTVIGSGGSLSIPAASATTDGYLAQADWTAFNNKISSTSLSAVYPLAYNPTTGIFSTALATTTIAQTYGTEQIGAITLATSSAATSNGVTVGQAITNTGGAFTFTPTISVANIPGSVINGDIGGNAVNVTGTVAVANGGTGWSAIQAGALVYGNGTSAIATTSAATGGNILAFLNNIPTWVSTTTLNIGGSSGSFTGSLIGDVTGTQGATAISDATVTGKLLTGYLSGAGTISATDSILGAIQKLNGNITALVTGVSSVANSDGTLIISPTSGAVTASLALGHANTWTALQQFDANASSTQFSAYKAYFGGTATTTIAADGTITTPGLTVNSSLSLPANSVTDAMVSDTLTASAVPGTGLTGTTLASNVVTSSLTSVGTLANLTVTNTITGSVSGNASTVTNGVYTNTFGGLFDTNLMATSSVANISALPNLATIGTIVTGVWHGTAIADSYISSAATWNAKQNAITGTTGQTPYFSADNTLTATSSLFLATTGNIGIGSTSPLSRLTIEGDVNLGVLATSTASQQLGTIVWNGTSFYGKTGTATAGIANGGWSNLAQDNTIDVFIIAGQSNAVGRGDYTKAPTATPGTVYQYENGAISMVTNQVGDSLSYTASPSTGNAWPAFADAYYRATGHKVLLVMTAEGSTGLELGTGGTTWDPTDPSTSYGGANLYQNSVNLGTAAIAAARGAGFTPVFKGVLWHQGETDAGCINGIGTGCPAAGVSAANYQTTLNALIAGYRTSFGSTAPFYIFEIAVNPTIGDPNGGSAAIRGAQTAMDGADPYTKVVFANAIDFAARGLMKGDGSSHYSQEGYNEMGRIGASNIVSARSGFALQRSSTTTPDLYFTSGRIGIGTTSPMAKLDVETTDAGSLLTKYRQDLASPASAFVFNQFASTTVTGSQANSGYANFDYTIVNPVASRSAVTAGRATEIYIPSTNTTSITGAVTGSIARAYNYGSNLTGALTAFSAITSNVGAGSTVPSVYGAQLTVGNGNLSNQYSTTTSAYGASVGLTNSSSNATIANRYGFYTGGANAGTITNDYGFYATGVGVSTGTGTITNKFDFYGADAGAYNYFAGNVGIGITPNTNYKLEVNGTASTTALIAGDITDTALTSQNGSLISADATGKLIKTTCSTALICSGGTLDINIGAGNGLGYNGGSFYIDPSSSNSWVVAQGFGSTTPYAQLSVGTATAGYTGALFAVNNSTYNTLFTVLGGGNVGIGTTTPGAKLAVVGNGAFTGSVFTPLLSQYSHYDAYGDSITAGNNASDAAHRYVNLIASALNVTFVNHGQGGWQAADAFDAIYVNAAPTSSGSQLFTYLIGTNDVFYNQSHYGASVDQESNFKLFDMAALAYLAIPNSNKVFGQTAATSTGWTKSGYYGGAMSEVSYTNGSTAQFTVTGSVIYIAYTMLDGSGGTFNVSVDGVTVAAATSTGINGSLIATKNLTNTHGSALLRIPNLTNTNHTVILTVTSATDPANTVRFDWAAGAGGNYYHNGPTVVTGSIPHSTNVSITDSMVNLYNGIIRQNVLTLASDGLNVAFADDSSYVNVPADLDVDGLHPGDAGHAKIASAFLATINSGSSARVKSGALAGNVLSTLLTVSGNQLGINTLNPTLAFDQAAGVVPKLQISGTDGSAAASVLRYSTAGGSRFVLARTRGTSEGVFAPLVDTDAIGRFVFSGSTNSTDASSTAAVIQALVDGTPSATNLPGALTFLTTPGAPVGGTFTNAVERMRITSNGLVGIGTTSPYANLSIQNPYGSNTTTLFAVASSTSTNGSTASTYLSVLANGNVGIGTANPQTKLDVLGIASSTRYYAGDGTATLPAYSFASSPTTGLYQDVGYVGLSVGGTRSLAISTSYFQASGNIVTDTAGTAVNPAFKYSGSGAGMFFPATQTLALSTNSIERLRIDSAGNTGIGSTTPFAKLSLQATAGDTTPLFAISSSTNGTGTTTPFFVASNGYIGVGTTMPGHAIDIVGNSWGSAGLMLYNIDSSVSSFSNSVLTMNRARYNTTAVQQGDTLGGLSWRGFDGTSYGSSASINALAMDNFTTAAHGSKIAFNVTNQASTTGITPMVLSPLSLTLNYDYNYATPFSTTNSAFNVTATSSLQTNADYYGIVGGAFSVNDRLTTDATNKGVMIGVLVNVAPRVDRNNVPHDDVNGVMVSNAGTAKATDAFYVTHSANFAGSEWSTIFTSDANSDYGIRLMGTYANEMLNLANKFTVKASGNTGIGTSSPLARLDVAGVNNDTTSPLFQLSSVASYATTTRFMVTAAGNVGIGTTTPWGQLSASSTSAYPTLAIQQLSTGPAAIFLGGNVGIGDATPTQLLTVGGNQSTSGYLRVGSETAPLNTTAGDLTTTRLAVSANGKVLGGGSLLGEIAIFDGIITGTNSVEIGVGVYPTLSAAPPSGEISSSYRVLDLSSIINTTASTTGVGASGITAGYFENRVTRVADLAEAHGILSIGLTFPAIQSAGAIGEVDGGYFQSFNSFGTGVNAASSTITKAIGVRILNGSNGGSTAKLAIGQAIGLGIEGISGATSSTAFFIGTTTNVYAPGNYAIYSGNTNQSYFAGNLGVGTTSPATLLEVGGSTANITFDGYKNCTGFTSNANGLVACTASDQRLKQSITPLAGADVLAAIGALNPVSFYWKPETDRGSKQQYGFIAQQVQSVFPNLVQTSSPTALTPDGTMSVNYEGLIAPAIVAIQQLDARTSFIGNTVRSATSTVTLDAATGNIGIRTTNPKHMLDIAGDAGADAFILHAPAAGAVTAFTLGTTTMTASIPSAVLTASGEVDLYKLATYNLSGIALLVERLAAQDVRMDSLEVRITKLEDGSITVASGSPLTISTSTIAEALQNFGILIENGIAQFDTLVARRFVAATDSNGNSIAGSGTVLAGNTVIEIHNPYVMATSKVLVTMTSNINGAWFVTDKQNGSFRVKFAESQTGDVTFDYFIIETEGQLATPSAASSTPITLPSVQPAPVPATSTPTITMTDSVATTTGNIATSTSAVGVSDAGAATTTPSATTSTPSVTTEPATPVAAPEAPVAAASDTPSAPSTSSTDALQPVSDNTPSTAPADTATTSGQ